MRRKAEVAIIAFLKPPPITTAAITTAAAMTMAAALVAAALVARHLNLFPCRAKSLIWQETLLYNLSEFNIILRDEYSS